MRLAVHSIAIRLTLGVGLVALLVFAGTGTLLHRALRADLEAADAASLRGKLDVVEHFVDEAARSGDIRSLFHHLDDVSIGHDGLHIWLYDAAGNVVYGQPRLIGRSGSSGSVGTPPQAVDVMERQLPATAPWAGGLVQVGMQRRHREQLLRRHAATLGAVCGLGVAATAMLGLVTARRCLHVATRLSAEATALSPRTPGARLTEPAGDMELTGLVRAFNRALDRIETAHGQVQAFNANVAHELRTPLASLGAGTQWALAAGRTPDDLRATLASNLEELELLGNIVNDMLFLSRADSGARAEGLESIQLGAEADKALHYCEALLHEAGLACERHGDATAACNAPLVRRAIVNLLTNAIRHSTVPGIIRVTVSAAGAVATLTVENAGTPIAESVQARMFDRFFRGDPARDRARSGHGLGLAIVAAVAAMHGGSVHVSRAGGCNRIGISLPLLPADAPLARESMIPSSAEEDR